MRSLDTCRLSISHLNLGDATDAESARWRFLVQKHVGGKGSSAVVRFLLKWGNPYLCPLKAFWIGVLLARSTSRAHKIQSTQHNNQINKNHAFRSPPHRHPRSHQDLPSCRRRHCRLEEHGRFRRFHEEQGAFSLLMPRPGG